MDNLQDLLFSRDFDDYRLAEIDIGTDYIRDLLKNQNADPSHVRGAMDMLRKIIIMPKTIAKTPEQVVAATVLIDRALSVFEAKTVKKYLEMDDGE